MSHGPIEPGITLAQFADEFIAALRAEGLTGPLELDATKKAVVHAERGAMDIGEAYHALSSATADNRERTIAKLARVHVRPPTLPRTWGEACDRVVPVVKPRIVAEIEDARRHKAGIPRATPRSEITPHLFMEIAVPADGAHIGVGVPDLAGWGVSVEAVMQQALRNLEARSGGDWLASPEAPGVARSPWRDGLDASRLCFPASLARARGGGRPVAIAPMPDQLLVTRDDDPDGLFHLARVGRRSLETHQASFFVRPIRVAPDGASWEDWLPPADHPAYGPLRLLQASNEAADYAAQARLVREIAGPTAPIVRLPGLSVLQSTLGADVLTMTTWRDGEGAALPKAAAILFQRGGDVLGFAPWEAVVAALPKMLTPVPGYPQRFLAATFPEPWQLGNLSLQPWTGPVPG